MHLFIPLTNVQYWFLLVLGGDFWCSAMPSPPKYFMLIGEFSTKLTEGQRLALPKKFRQELGDFLIVTRGYEGCLVIVNKKQFEKLTEGIAAKPFIKGDVRETTRFLLSGAHEIELDEQGRFVIPQSLREEVGIDSEVVFLGLLNWLEAWDHDRWQEHKAKLAEKSTEIAERLACLEE